MASSSHSLLLPLLSLAAFILFALPALSTDSPANPPSLPPAADISPSPTSPPSPPPSDISSSPTPAPSPALAISSPPPSDLAPSSQKSPTPAPEVAGDASSEEDDPNAADLEVKEDSFGGMNGGKKAGIAIGVIAGACAVGVGAMVLKKRRQNIRRSRFGETQIM